MARSTEAPFRTNVEAGFIGGWRHRTLQQLMGWSAREALGVVLYLWSASQGEGKVGGTAKQICRWSDVYVDQARFISALVESQLITPDGEEGGEPAYLINGNERQLVGLAASRAKKSAAGTLGAQKRWGAPGEGGGGGSPNSPSSIEPGGNDGAENESSGEESPSETGSSDGEHTCAGESLQENGKSIASDGSVSGAGAKKKKNGVLGDTPSFGFGDDPPPQPRFDFEAVYQKFPKRPGGRDMRKIQGMTKLAAQIKTPERYEALSRAVDNYATHCRAQRAADPNWRFSVQWGTFCAKDYWPEWIATGGDERPSQPQAHRDSGLTEKTWDDVLGGDDGQA